MKMIERDVAAQGKDFLTLRGWRMVRTQFAFTPGAFSTGEPGMADALFIRYMPSPEVPARCLCLWVEWKGPRDKRTCQCRPGERKICKVCRQQRWQANERLRGALVWQVSSLEQLERLYGQQFGFLHRERPIYKQTSLL